MTDFKIRRGLSTSLFDNVTEGKINPKLVIEDGCWYLCTDTAELYLGIVLADGSKSLKRINGDSTLAAITEIQKELDKLETTQLYRQIAGEHELPTDFEASDFNPNVVYYIIHKTAAGDPIGTCSAYLFDKGAQSYMCTNNADMSTINDMVEAAIELKLEDKFAAMLPDEVAKAIQSVFAYDTVLYGGSA